jgi:hypothetical protein
MSSISRRRFLGTSLAGTGALIAAPAVWTSRANGQSPNDEIRLGVIGAGGRGGGLSGGFATRNGASIVAVADPDEKHANSLAEARGGKPYIDLRELLDDENVDAVIVSTCNHWHCLAAIWAMEAGKDVYVEKPLSHTQWEGRQVVKAARKYNKIVQVGTQQRSDPLQAAAKKFLHEDKALGKILYAQANRLGARASIGKRDTPLTIPEEVNYDLWLGPAADEPLYRDSLHYDWHWDWNTGSGEMGNWGVHVLDDVRNVAYQDSVSTPKRIMSVGGRVGWNDAGNTPNVHYVCFDTGEFPTLIALSNLNEAPGGRSSWKTKADRPFDSGGSGYVVACEGGYYLGQRGSGKAVDLEGKEIRSFKGGDRDNIHKDNFLDAVRSRDASTLNTEVEVGHNSTGWCNLANVAYKAGKPFSASEALSIYPEFDAWELILREMHTQLAPYGSGLADAEITMSPILTHDPETEQFVGENAAAGNAFLKRQYRSSYEVPEIG